MLILVGCFAPLALFKLLAFVDPGTSSSGAAMRAGLAAQGGLSGLLPWMGPLRRSVSSLVAAAALAGALTGALAAPASPRPFPEVVPLPDDRSRGG